MASKKPPRTNVQRSAGSPFKSASTPGPRTPTLITITTMLFHQHRQLPYTSSARTHAPDKRERRRLRKLLDVAVERERVRYADGEDRGDELARDEERDEPARVLGHERDEDVRDRVAEDDAERAHALHFWC